MPLRALLVGIALFWGGASLASGQQVHLLAVGDTLDPAIGTGVQSDIDTVVPSFFILLSEGQLEFERVQGEDVAAETILEKIDQIRLQPDDALVFYWSGHGAMDDNGQYLQMPRGGNLYRTTLLGALKKKKARLIVLMTDCCNSYHDSTASKPSVAPSSPALDRKTSPLFDELFFKTQGLVDVNAAERGEMALGTREGGLFTLSLFYMMPGRSLVEGNAGGREEAFGVFWRNAEKRLSWETVIEQSRRQVQELFTEMNPEGLVGRDGNVYRKQTVAAWALPEAPKVRQQADRGSRFGVEAVDNRGEGVRVVRVWANFPGTRVEEVDGNKIMRLQPGDVILSINGRRLAGTREYWDAVKSSPRTMEMTVRDVRDGTKRRFRVQLQY